MSAKDRGQRADDLGARPTGFMRLGDYVRPPNETLTSVLAAWRHPEAKEPADAPARFGFMSKGEFFRVRVLTADDSDRLLDFLQEGLSDHSRELRFLTSVPQVRARVSDQLSERDGYKRVGLITTTGEGPQEIIVAMAEYAVLPDDEPPEVAIAVADDFQHRGIGTSLITALATLSLAAGHQKWSGDVLHENDPVFALLGEVGHVSVTDESGGVAHIEIDLDPAKVLVAH
ncbi:MAG: GNAT family N-acetyltransferase [Candidatus Nanopelagicales bacterium]